MEISFYGKKLQAFKSSIHSHSTCSDGDLTPQEVMRRYANSGFEVFALTDHCVKSDYTALESYGMTLLPGAEVHPAHKDDPFKTWWHVIALGFNDSFDPMTAGETSRPIQETIDAIVAADGVAFIAHPNWSGFQYDDIINLKNISGMEVWNNGAGLVARADSSQLLNDLVDRGVALPLIAVDDMHVAFEPIGGWTIICAPDRTPESLMKALKSGSFYATCGPEFRSLSYENGIFRAEFTTCRMANVAMDRTHGAFSPKPINDTLPTETNFIEVDMNQPRYQAVKGFRCEITDQYGRRAWSAPIFK